MIKIRNHGHACFEFITDSVNFVVDPYRDISGLKMKKIITNKVFCSHDHYDHCATENVEVINEEKNISFKTIEVPHDHHNGAKRGMNLIHIFDIDGIKIAHFGDIGCIPEKEILKQLEGLDIALLPINGFYTISAKELVELVDLIKPKLTIPMHYYRSDRNLGLEDDGQINILKQLVNYEEIDEKIYEFCSKTPAKPYLIFKNSEGDLR